MKKSRKPAVREPVQVYLASDDRALLDQVALKASLSRAEVLRRGLRRFGAEVLSEDNAMLAFLADMEATAWPPDMPPDVAARHDDHLAESYAPAPKRRAK